MAIVQLRITSSGKVKNCEEGQARRFAKANPKEYTLVEPPHIEVAALPPIKKKEAVAAKPSSQHDSEPINIGQDVPSDKPKPKNEPTPAMKDVLEGNLKTTRTRATKSKARSRKSK